MTALAAQSTTAPGPVVGLVAVTLPADPQLLRSVWIDDNTLLVGYDPAWITSDLVEIVIRAQYGTDVTIISGIPA